MEKRAAITQEHHYYNKLLIWCYFKNVIKESDKELGQHIQSKIVGYKMNVIIKNS